MTTTTITTDSMISLTATRIMTVALIIQAVMVEVLIMISHGVRMIATRVYPGTGISIHKETGIMEPPGLEIVPQE